MLNHKLILLDLKMTQWLFRFETDSQIRFSKYSLS